MGKDNPSRSNAFWKQLFRHCVNPFSRYLCTVLYILCTPERFFTFALKKKITSYVDISDDHLSSRVRQPLAPLSYLISTATFVAIVISLYIGSSLLSQFLSLGFIFSFLIIAIIFAVYMVIVTGRFKDITFFINYFCYNISTIYFAIFMPLLLVFLFSFFDWNRKLKMLISEESFIVWFIVGLVCFLYLLWSWLVTYLYIVHPVLTFHKTFGINIYRLVFSILLFWSVFLTGSILYWFWSYPILKDMLNLIFSNM